MGPTTRSGPMTVVKSPVFFFRLFRATWGPIFLFEGTRLLLKTHSDPPGEALRAHPTPNPYSLLCLRDQTPGSTPHGALECSAIDELPRLCPSTRLHSSTDVTCCVSLCTSRVACTMRTDAGGALGGKTFSLDRAPWRSAMHASAAVRGRRWSSGRGGAPSCQPPAHPAVSHRRALIPEKNDLIIGCPSLHGRPLSGQPRPRAFPHGSRGPPPVGGRPPKRGGTSATGGRACPFAPRPGVGANPRRPAGRRANWRVGGAPRGGGARGPEGGGGGGGGGNSPAPPGPGGGGGGGPHCPLLLPPPTSARGRRRV